MESMMSRPKRNPPPAVPQTISGRKWGRLRDSLPFPAEPGGVPPRDLARRIRFGHQRSRRHLS
jgi:hypothetical protein